MLPKNRRIQRKLFSNTVLVGQRYNSTHFLVYINKIEESKPSLFSFSVSKKVCKKAVDRNRLRRRGYSVISKHLNEIKPGFVCFFTSKKGSEILSFDQIEKEITQILTGNKIIN